MNGIKDEFGCYRYTMDLPELQDLYKKFENFVADCLPEEVKENKAAIVQTFALIKKHIDETYN